MSPILCHFCQSSPVTAEWDGWLTCEPCHQLLREENGRTPLALAIRAASLIVDEVGPDQVLGEILIRAAMVEHKAFWAARRRTT